MTDTTPPPIPHRSWCIDPDNLYVFEDHGIVIARCRSCRAEYLDYPDEHLDWPAT